MNIQEKPTAVVVFSGGQDSTTCLYWAKEQGFHVIALTINYGQKHAREIEAAKIIAERAGVRHEIIDVGPILRGTSPLVNSAAPLEKYADHTALPGGLEKTFVPMRNQFFLTLAANFAYSVGSHVLVTGVCQEDFGGYPDCRQTFINAFAAACNEGTFTNEPDTLPHLRVLTPLMYLTKAQSVELAEDLPGCYASLAYSHTAYDGAYPPVGKDHASLLRLKGFLEAGVPDPLVLRAVHEKLMPMPTADNYDPALVLAYSASLDF